MRYGKSKTHVLKNLQLSSILVPDETNGSFTGTKLMCTLGPSSQEVDVLVEMLNSGMSSARIDLTWGSLEFHRRTLANLQVAMQKTRKLCSIVLDTLGREIMIIRQPDKIDPNGWQSYASTIPVKVGQKVIITTRKIEDISQLVLPCSYMKLPNMCEKGDTIYLGRYLVSGADSSSLYVEVSEVNDTDVVCIAQNDAELEGLLTIFHMERSRDALVNMQNDLPLLSEHDKEFIVALSNEFEIDYISLSYTRTAEDVREARTYLDGLGLTATKILAKVETRQALLNFMGILNEADGIIMSRGNLGLDCAPEKIALIQKTLISSSNMVGKPVIITRVVDTMASAPRPTRAEATDVANAVLDSVDGIILGAETLRGTNPVESVATVRRICCAAEAVFDHHHHFEHLMDTAIDAEDPMGDSDDDREDADGFSFQGGATDYGAPPQQPAQLSMTSLQQLPGNGALHTNGSARSSSGSQRAVVNAAGTHTPDATLHGGPSAASYSSLSNAIRAMAKFGATSQANLNLLDKKTGSYKGSPYLSKLESIASSAVRAAEKVGASLIVVFTHSGKTAQLVAKYRPPMPIVTLVVPRLVSDGISWKLEGRANARQCMMVRGLLPMLAAPGPSGDAILEESIAVAGRMNLVKPHDHVVCIQRIQDDFAVKIVAVDELCQGIKVSDPVIVGKLKDGTTQQIKLGIKRSDPVMVGKLAVDEDFLKLAARSLVGAPGGYTTASLEHARSGAVVEATGYVPSPSTPVLTKHSAALLHSPSERINSANLPN